LDFDLLTLTLIFFGS